MMNQATNVDIQQLTMAEKIGLMELLWLDISKESQNVDVPEWHLKVLEERERAVANGEDEFIDFEVAMVEIRKRIATRRKAQ